VLGACLTAHVAAHQTPRVFVVAHIHTPSKPRRRAHNSAAVNSTTWVVYLYKINTHK
jgi:hypothetical protein